MLAHDRLGFGHRVVLVHGFTQTRHCWVPVDRDLARDHEVVRVDLPGHGESADVRADVAEGAALIADVGGEAPYIGYSMGARHLLRLLVDRPAVVTALVLIGATAGIDDPDARAERHRADEELAGAIERDGAAAFIDRWLEEPPYVRVVDAGRFEEARHANTAAGLAASLRLAGAGAAEPLWDRLAPVECPVLLVAGAADIAYVRHAQRLAATLGPLARVLVIPGAGHAAHLEQPKRFLAAVRIFLAQHGL